MRKKGAAEQYWAAALSARVAVWRRPKRGFPPLHVEEGICGDLQSRRFPPFPPAAIWIFFPLSSFLRPRTVLASLKRQQTPAGDKKSSGGGSGEKEEVPVSKPSPRASQRVFARPTLPSPAHLHYTPTLPRSSVCPRREGKDVNQSGHLPPNSPPPPRHLLRTLSSPAASPSQMENEEGGGNRGNEWRREAEIFLFYHLHSPPLLLRNPANIYGGCVCG